MKYRVTDHAVMRYLERVKGVDFGEIRKQIMTDELARAIAAGAQTVKIGNAVYTIKNQCVITVTTHEPFNSSPAQRKKAKRNRVANGG